MKPIIIALSLVALSCAYAQAQSGIDCRKFRKNADGSWSATEQMTIAGPNGNVQIGPGVSFNPGVAFSGVDLAATLNRECSTGR